MHSIYVVYHDQKMKRICHYPSHEDSYSSFILLIVPMRYFVVAPLVLCFRVELLCCLNLMYVSIYSFLLFSEYKYLIVNLVFSHLGFRSGNFFPIAPFPDRCLLVPFSFSSSLAEIRKHYNTT